MNQIDCMPREKLKEYLAGWADPEQSDVIESHLAECPQCEQTIVQLEEDPDTLVELLRQDDFSGRPASAGSDPLMESALANARQQIAAEHSAMDSSGEWSLPPGDIAAYEILEPLGRGGMGSVYLARHRKLGKRVAIKLLPARTFRNDHFTARFQREIRAAGELDHPSIVRATDAGEHEGTHYLVMEHIEGLDLSQIARLTGADQICDACEMMRQVALGLSHAHAAGIVHRDIKPSNLMLSRTGEVKILDFGLARMGPWDEASAELTTVGQLMGTLDYMAPEQAERADTVDYRADLYSLGATLFRLLCGHPPLCASPELSPLAKLRLLATHESPSLGTLRPDAPSQLIQLTSSLLARDPAKRPPSAAHVAETLSDLADGHDLVSLIQQADSRQQASATEAPTETPALLTKELTVSQGSPTRNRWIGWIAAGLMLPLIGLAGVLITLETQKGQLVIRSDAEASVELMREGEVYRSFKVEPGTESTKLYAGKYRVVLAQGSDALQIDNDGNISILKGETTVADLRLKSPDASEPDTKAAVAQQDFLGALSNVTTPSRNEPIYENQPLSFWLDIVARERSQEALGQAFEAVRALTAPSTSARVTEAMLKTLPDMSGRAAVGPSNNRQRIDHLGFEILRKAHPGLGYAQLLVRELEQANNPTWKQRLISQSYLAEADIAPLVAWMDAEVFAKNADAQIAENCAQQYFAWLIDALETDDLQRDRMLDSLLDCESLSDTFWLRSYPSYGTHGDLGNIFRDQAVRIFGDSESSLELAVPAAMVLSSEQFDYSESQREEIIPPLRVWLDRVRQGNLLDTLSVDGFEDYVVPIHVSSSRNRRGVAWPPRGSSFYLNARIQQPLAIPVIEFVELAEAVDLQDDVRLQPILDATKEAANRVASFALHKAIELDWGTFEVLSIQDTLGRGRRADNSNLASSIPKARDWAAYFVHDQVARALVKEEETYGESQIPILDKVPYIENREKKGTTR